jgi:hypothetical protein
MGSFSARHFVNVGPPESGGEGGNAPRCFLAFRDPQFRCARVLLRSARMTPHGKPTLKFKKNVSKTTKGPMQEPGHGV